MTAEENIHTTALMRHRAGSALIWIGVLIWLPFLLLRIIGQTPSMLWFLPFHLAGVIGGARLRASARRKMGMSPRPKSRLQIFGYGLIIAGILVWAPYFYLKISRPLDVMDFLPFHLIGVLAGSAVLAIDRFRAKR